MSNERKRNNIIISLTLVIYTFLYFIFINKEIPKYSSVINLAFILILTIVTYFMYGFQRSSINETRKKVIKEVIIGTIIYLVITYILGIFTGYEKTNYTINIISILSLVTLEILRYILINSNKDSKEYMIYLMVAVLLMDIVINTYNIGNTSYMVFVYVTTVIIPLIYKNIVLSYITYNIGYLPCIIYVIMMYIIYLIPYTPMIGNYLNIVLTITLLTMIYIYTTRIVEEKDLIKPTIILIPLIIVVIIVGLLTSVKFKYSILGVDISNYKDIERGDLIIVKDIEYSEYEEEDIIVYKENEKIVIDEITKIEEEKIYITYNEEYKEIEKDRIIGRYENKKISKLGTPTVWFNNLLYE